jgi:hypothetical protein
MKKKFIVLDKQTALLFNETKGELIKTYPDKKITDNIIIYILCKIYKHKGGFKWETKNKEKKKN